jgi:diguanylate cyclase (GGDEF)-like protein/PAS domain S-box-containing protein
MTDIRNPFSNTLNWHSRPLATGAWTGVLTLVYFLAAKAGLYLAIAPGSASPVWPPAGIAVAALLMLGRPVWPAILLGETLAVSNEGLPLSVSVGMGLGNSLEALMATWLIVRLAKTHYPFCTLAQVVSFLMAGAIGPGSLGAICGVTSLYLGGIIAEDALWTTFWTWWTGDALGIIVLTPMILAWPRSNHVSSHFLRLLEFAVLFAASIATTMVVFGSWIDPGQFRTSLLFVYLPLLAWAAYRFELRWVSSLTATLSLLAILCTSSNSGPFASTDTNTALLALQIYLGIITATTLVLVGVIAERRQDRRQLQEANQHLEQRVHEATEDLRTANRHLEEERNFMATVQDTTAALLVVMDRNGRILSFNRASQELSGFSAEEAIGRTPWELFIPEEQRQEAQEVFFNLKAGMFPSQHKNHWRSKDGTLHLTEWRNTAIVDDEGNVAYVIALGQDISEKHRTEAELKRLHDHLGLLLESTGEGIYGVDTEMRCTFVNRAAQDLLGYSREEILGKDMHRLIHHSYEDGQPYPLEDCPIFITLREGRPMTTASEVAWTRDGKALPIHYTANPIWEDGVISGAVVVFRDIAEERAMVKRMDYLASHDSLTGLNNRHAFEIALENAYRTARQGDEQHVMCYLDLDQFKVVNDTCGHVAGDELLRQLASLLRKQVRRGDVLARLGGDEFGVLLLGCGLERAVELMEGVRKLISEYRFVWEGKNFSIGVSIGIVPIDRRTENLSQILSRADAACYLAKDSGRNRIHVHQPDDRELARRHGEMQWVSRIHDAFEDNRFHLVGQPIVPVQKEVDGIGLEILLRLVNDEGHEVPPGAFLPAAERFNLAPSIDRWVIRTAFRWLSRHPQLLPRVWLFNINLSGQTVGDNTFMEMILAEAEAYDLPREKICLEITETAAVANLRQASTFITTLRKQGFRFALDDFGSGMSSFAYLKGLPVDFLKIDGNFVRDIVTDQVDHAMVEAINRVGQVMGIETIAEFVENDEIMKRLKDIGVDYAQGYALGPPRPLVDLF